MYHTFSLIRVVWDQVLPVTHIWDSGIMMLNLSKSRSHTHSSPSTRNKDIVIFEQFLGFRGHSECKKYLLTLCDHLSNKAD